MSSLAVGGIYSLKHSAKYILVQTCKHFNTTRIVFVDRQAYIECQFEKEAKHIGSDFHKRFTEIATSGTNETLINNILELPLCSKQTSRLLVSGAIVTSVQTKETNENSTANSIKRNNVQNNRDSEITHESSKYLNKESTVLDYKHIYSLHLKYQLEEPLHTSTSTNLVP